MQVLETYTPTKEEKRQTNLLITRAKESMIDLCDYIYRLCEKGSRAGVRNWLIEEYKFSAATVSKMYNVGFIVNNSSFELPNEYSKIYELSPVKEQLIDFNNYLTESDQDITGMTQKEIRDCVKHFFGEETESDKKSATVSRKLIYSKLKTLQKNFSTYNKRDVQNMLENIIKLMEGGEPGEK